MNTTLSNLRTLKIYNNDLKEQFFKNDYYGHKTSREKERPV